MDDMIKRIMTRVKANVRKHGVHVQGVLGGPEQGGGFSYSVGLNSKNNHPEIFMAGFNPDMMHSLINDVAALVKAGSRFAEPCFADKIIADYLVAFRPLTRESANEYGSVAIGYFHRPIEGVQMFLPDVEGKFPWDEGCNPEYARLQTYLFETEGEIPTTAVSGIQRVN